jgi:signal-transduction protein with cAMP-binding, CBS, and nucleotidyltransferase domain
MNQTIQQNEDLVIDHIATLIEEDMPTQSIREIVSETYQVIGERFTELFSKAFTR